MTDITNDLVAGLRGDITTLAAASVYAAANGGDTDALTAAIGAASTSVDALAAGTGSLGNALDAVDAAKVAIGTHL